MTAVNTPVKFSEQLEEELVPLWEQVFNTRVFKLLLSDEPVKKELLQLYLIESYHYVKHNAQHQALAVWQKDVRDRDFMRAALHHAYEEVDHDLLAIKDLEKMGLKKADIERSMPLPETLGFTGYLYYAVTRENPVGRLGYSIWAEGTQEMGPGVVKRIMQRFGIEDEKHISFFAAHAKLDMRHGEECKESIDRFCKTPEDQQAVRVVAHTSLRLFLYVLEAIYDRYMQVLEGAPVLRMPPEDVKYEASGFRL